MRRGFSSGGGTRRMNGQRERARFPRVRGRDQKKAQEEWVALMVELMPTIADAHILYEQQDWDPCAEKLECLIRRGMKTALVYDSLGSTVQYQGRLEYSIECFRKALQIDPTMRAAHDRLIMVMDAMPETTIARAQRERDRWWKRYGEAAYARRRPHLNNRDPERPIRIGYVSGDYQYHSAATVFHRIVMQHSEGYEPYLYSSTPSKYWATSVTQGFAYHPNWRNFVEKRENQMGLPEDVPWPASDVYGKILSDEIDILVDLSSYTSHNRLDVFAMKPAPIQLSGWGYANGNGWPAMDYLVTDRVVVPEDRQHEHVERMMYLPCVIDYEPTVGLPDVNPLPCLRKPVTFGVFQRSLKINPETVEVWRQILERLPDSRLMFKSRYPESMKSWIRAGFQDQAKQVVFIGASSSADHKALYRAVDLNLDPWPQTAGVSACDALHMGTPAVTLIGPRVIQRTTASLLTILGLTDFIAETEDEYIEKAVSWVTTRKHELAEIRAGLREKFAASPIQAGYLAEVERAYRTAWREWCAKPLTVQDAAYRLEKAS